MKIFFVFLVSLFCGCIHQAPPTIAIPQTPRVLIVDSKEKLPKIMKNEESFSRPNPTVGYIENQAFPCVPRVWLVRSGKKILLVGEEKEGPPVDVLDWQIFEFSLPPGENKIIVERWVLFLNHGGWQTISQEEFDFEVAKPRRGWGGYWGNNHYDWRIIIRQNRSYVYEGGRTDWGHGRRGW